VKEFWRNAVMKILFFLCKYSVLMAVFLFDWWFLILNGSNSSNSFYDLERNYFERSSVKFWKSLWSLQGGRLWILNTIYIYVNILFNGVYPSTVIVDRGRWNTSDSSEEYRFRGHVSGSIDEQRKGEWTVQFTWRELMNPRLGTERDLWEEPGECTVQNSMLWIWTEFWSKGEFVYKSFYLFFNILVCVKSSFICV
jgi:hypothetical protein